VLVYRFLSDITIYRLTFGTVVVVLCFVVYHFIHNPLRGKEGYVISFTSDVVQDSSHRHTDYLTLR